MAMRRPRIKAAANLSIRRPAKVSTCNGDQKILERSSGITLSDRGQDKNQHELVESETIIGKKSDETPKIEKKTKNLKHASTPSPINEQSAFKFPRPVEEASKMATSVNPLEVNTDEPHSPKKLESKFAYINALNSPRKRIRTESMTSNKSYSDVSLKSRKTTKQEESQKASDAKRDLRKRLNNIQNVDKQSLTMFDMIYYNPVKNPMKNPALSIKGSLENIPHTVDRESRSMTKSRSPTPALMPPPEIPSAPAVQPTPQIKLGPNGEMILDEASLVIENEREKAIRDSMAKADIVYVDEFSGNSGYYSRFKRTKDWPPEETIRFYRCLHTIGTDFSMMIQLFPNRSRRDLKLKFKKEERLNLKLVNKALLFPKEFNIEELKQQFLEEDKEIERLREQERQEKAELEEKIKLQKITRKMQLNQNKNRNPKKRVSKAARVMLNIDLANKEEVNKDVKPKRNKSKITSKTERQQEAAVSKERKPSSASDSEPCAALDAEEGNVDISSEQEESVPRIDNVPYIPNGDFEQQEEAPNNESSTELPTSPLHIATLSNESPLPAESIESPPDINAMDIDIIDEQSRKVYEIKAEPQVYPVPTVHSGPNSEDIITLQNLDDQSQTVDCHDSVIMDNREQLSVEVDYKYYETGGAVYQPMLTNAPIAHPVKSEIAFSSTNETAINDRILSPPPPSNFHSISNHTSVVVPTSKVTPNFQDISTCEESNSVETCTSPTPLKPKSGNEPYMEDSNGVQESLSSEEHQTPIDISEDVDEEPDETDEEPRGLGPLEDIDINSLVLVESQDTTNPGKTIYEIYVTDPETGKLSEKPLDVPEDVIENIRSILEAGEE